MGQITNDFSWSFSRSRSFADCLRRYFHDYYGSWGGWDAYAPAEARQAYLLKKMQTLDLLAGQIVQDVIDHHLGAMAKGGGIAPADAREAARGMLAKALRESEERRWRQNAKRFTNLFEHYYGLDPDVLEERLERTREKIEACLGNFHAEGFQARLRAIPPDHWFPVNKIDAMELHGLKVFAAPDFAYREGDRTAVIDWKTGKESDDYEFQLTLYALFAREKWRADPARTRASVVYLLDGNTRQVPISPDRLAAVEDRIASSAAAMRELLDDPARNAASKERFPMTEDLGKCRRCNYKELCRR